VTAALLGHTADRVYARCRARERRDVVVWILVGLLAVVVVIAFAAVRSWRHRTRQSRLASRSPDEWRSALAAADAADLRRSSIHPVDTSGGV
jgi:hypothetical protein